MSNLQNIFWREAIDAGMTITIKQWESSGNFSYVAAGTHLISWTSQDAKEAQEALDLSISRLIKSAPMSEHAEFILSYAVPHECGPQRCSQNCPDDCIEIPSAIFVEATKTTEKRHDGTPQAPD